jgi:hypothetical protein
LFDLFLWLLGLAALPLGLAWLESLVFGGGPGSGPPAFDTTEPASCRSGLEPAPTLVMVDSAMPSSYMRLYAGLGNSAVAIQGGCDSVLRGIFDPHPFEAAAGLATPSTS